MATTALKPNWYATLRQVAQLSEAPRRDGAGRARGHATSAEIDLRIARALERRGLLFNPKTSAVRSHADSWYITEAGLNAIGNDVRPTPDADDLAIAEAMVYVLDEMGITTTEAYNQLNADCEYMIRQRAELQSDAWTPCLRNTAEHIGHDEARGEDCLTEAYGDDGMGGWIHTDGVTYLHDPATSTYKNYADMEIGDIIAWAGRPEAKIVELNATTSTDLLGRDFPAHIAELLDGSGRRGTIPFGPSGAAPVKHRPACDRLDWREMLYRRAVQVDAACPHLGHAADDLIAEAYDAATAINDAMPRRVPTPECAEPGNITYELDGGRHLWRLEGSDLVTEIPPFDVDTVTDWATRAIAAGAVTGIPAGTAVVGWKRLSDDGAEWLVPIVGPGPDPDRDRDSDRDRDQPVKVNPATVARRIRHRPVTVPGTGTEPATGTGTAHTGTGGTGTTRTGTETWAQTAARAGRDRDRAQRPALTLLVATGTGTASTTGTVLARGSATPDGPDRITTRTDGLPTVGHTHLDSARRDRAGAVALTRGTPA